jgi:hypothetical protein
MLSALKSCSALLPEFMREQRYSGLARDQASEGKIFVGLL